jgi:hypothetical protein
LAPVLDRALPGQVRTQNVGGLDGVTGANQFDVRTLPDGGTALLLPGAAVLAWLVGDPRVHFDIGHWLPLLITQSAPLLIGRPELAGLAPGRAFRIAASSPAGPELPALLALDLLGIKATPVFGLNDAGGAQEAFMAGQVDAVLLHDNHPMQNRMTFLAGATPLMVLDSDQNTSSRQAVPSAGRLLAERNAMASPLFSAWQSTMMAVALDMALVLPRLTPAAIVAQWRRAIGEAAASLPVRLLATETGVQVRANAQASQSLSPLLADATTRLALLRWLELRFKWRPG